MTAEGEPRQQLIKVLLVVVSVSMLASGAGWMLQLHLNELDQRVNFLRDQVMSKCIK